MSAVGGGGLGAGDYSRFLRSLRTQMEVHGPPKSRGMCTDANICGFSVTAKSCIFMNTGQLGRGPGLDGSDILESQSGFLGVPLFRRYTEGLLPLSEPRWYIAGGGSEQQRAKSHDRGGLSSRSPTS